MKHVVLFVLSIGLFITNYNCAPTKEAKKEKSQSYYKEVKDLIKTKDYKFVGDVVYNNKRRLLLEANSNTISIQQSKVFGQANSIDKTKKPLELKGVITDYKVNFNDDLQEISIEFSLEEKNFYIDIKPNGNAFLAIKYGVNNITQVGKIQQI